MWFFRCDKYNSYGAWHSAYLTKYFFLYYRPSRYYIWCIAFYTYSIAHKNTWNDNTVYWNPYQHHGSVIHNLISLSVCHASHKIFWQLNNHCILVVHTLFVTKLDALGMKVLVLSWITEFLRQLVCRRLHGTGCLTMVKIKQTAPIFLLPFQVYISYEDGSWLCAADATRGWLGKIKIIK
jgi:hypothetical protein